jgi:hypothetical protein
VLAACSGQEGAAARKVLLSSGVVRQLFLEDVAQVTEWCKQAAAAGSAAAAPGGGAEVGRCRVHFSTPLLLPAGFRCSAI